MLDVRIRAAAFRQQSLPRHFLMRQPCALPRSMPFIQLLAATSLALLFTGLTIAQEQCHRKDWHAYAFWPPEKLTRNVSALSQSKSTEDRILAATIAGLLLINEKVRMTVLADLLNDRADSVKLEALRACGTFSEERIRPLISLIKKLKLQRNADIRSEASILSSAIERQRKHN